jgi:iron complex outermembrane receptor protein
MRRSLLWLAIAAAGAVHAAEPNADRQPMEYLLVTVPLHRTEAETALPVTVIDGDELRERAARSIGATLDGSPGLATASFGPGVGQPVIRGQAGPRVRTLQNGLGTADASTVSADHAVAVEPLLAESVEVLRGPATLLYGGGAIGGVVNVIDNRIARTLPQRAFEGALEQRHDSASDGDTSVFALRGAAGSLAWQLDGTYRDWNAVEISGLAFNPATVDDLDESSDGYIANSDGRNHQLGGGLSWIFDRGYVGFSISDLRSGYGIPLGGHVHTEGEHDHDEDEDEEDHEAHDEHGGEAIRIDMKQRRYELAGEVRELSRALDALRWRVGYTDYEHSELEDGVKATTYSNETTEGRFELIHRELAGWHGVVGLQLRDTNFAALGEESFIPTSDTRAIGIFVIEDYHRGDWLYEIGLRADRDVVDVSGQGEQSFNAYSASVSALWNFSPRWSLGAALSRSQRAPVVDELYANVENAERHDDHFHYHDPVVHAATRAIEIGNADLKRETARNIDLTLRYRGEVIGGFVTLFHNDFSNYIFLANTGFEVDDVPVLEYRQQGARFHGAEFEIELPLAQGGFGELTLDLHGDWVRGELDRSGDVPRLTPWRVGARLALTRGAISSFVGALHAADQDRPGRFETATDGYYRLDAGISYALALGAVDTTLFLRGTNLTDEEIRASTSFLRDFAPEPGRALEAGVRLRF